MKDHEAFDRFQTRATTLLADLDQLTDMARENGANSLTLTKLSNVKREFTDARNLA